MNRYNLSVREAKSYLERNLGATNQLSSAALKHIISTEKRLSVLVRGELSKDQIQKFKSGGVGGTIFSEISELLLLELERNPNLNCIFDEADGVYDPEYDHPIFSIFERHYNEEVYTFLPAPDATKDLLRKCLLNSNCNWHSLCVVTSYALPKREDRSITREEIEEACSRAEMILILAYDAEGYILWERA